MAKAQNLSARAASPESVDPDVMARAFAKAVADGDIVNLRFLFMPFSPARGSETEQFGTDKYAYLLPTDEEEQKGPFREALRIVKDPDTWSYIINELSEERPARLPSNMLLPLADNAVAQGKFTSAAQAYELLRIRSRMQEQFLAQTDEALEKDDCRKAAAAMLVATGLDYDYAAFPEPLPLVPDFQKRSLMLHGEYPVRPEDSVPLQPLPTFLRTAENYLLLSSEIASRLEERPEELRVKLLAELVRQRDPHWDDFVANYHQACEATKDLQDRLDALREESESDNSLERSIEERLGLDPRILSAALLGRETPGGEWWQYLKELAYEHPPASLFVARQVIGDVEVLMPRYRSDSPVPAALGLLPRG
jgi:hypothetical protein